MEPAVNEPTTLPGVDETLLRLPALHVVAHRGAHRLVLGPPGAFVLTTAGERPEQTAVEVRATAHAARGELARHLAWVPFVDALVVVGAVDAPSIDGAVPVDLLLDVLVSGRDTISATALTTVQVALRARRLGDWQVGLPPTAMIDLCDPVQPTISP